MMAHCVQVVPVTLSIVTNVSAVRLYIPRDLTTSDNRKSVLKSVQEVEKRFPDGLPQLDPIEDMGIKDQRFSEIIKVCYNSYMYVFYKQSC